MSILNPQLCSAEQFQQVGSLCYSGAHMLSFGMKLFPITILSAVIIGISIGMISERITK